MWHHLSKVPALAARAIIGLAGVVAFGLVAVSAAHAEIKLGFQAPLTGFAAADGKSAKIAAEMAVEQINAAGGEIGQKLQLISYDDQAKSDQAIFTANKLIGEDGVKLVVNASYSAMLKKLVSVLATFCWLTLSPPPKFGAEGPDGVTGVTGVKFSARLR